MTRDELLHLQQRLEAAGFGERAIVAAAEADQAWRVHLKAFRAVKRALQESGLSSVPSAPSASGPTAAESGFGSESGFSDDGKPDSEATESVIAEQHSAAPDTRKTMARKGLLMAPGLRPAARAIGARLVDRSNPTTGRCDPSIGRLVKDEGFSDRSTRRAIAELEAAGLLRRTINAGRGRSNAFVLNWEALSGLAAAAEKADSENRTRAAKPDGRVRQNHERESLPAVGGERFGARQLELRVFGQVEGGKATSGDRIEAAIRGKYRADHQRLAVTLGAWWERSDAERRGFGDLGEFEAWLRAQGPPAASGTG